MKSNEKYPYRPIRYETVRQVEGKWHPALYTTDEVRHEVGRYWVQNQHGAFGSFTIPQYEYTYHPRMVRDAYKDPDRTVHYRESALDDLKRKKAAFDDSEKNRNTEAGQLVINVAGETLAEYFAGKLTSTHIDPAELLAEMEKYVEENLDVFGNSIADIPDVEPNAPSERAIEQWRREIESAAKYKAYNFCSKLDDRSMLFTRRFNEKLRAKQNNKYARRWLAVNTDIKNLDKYKPFFLRTFNKRNARTYDETIQGKIENWCREYVKDPIINSGPVRVMKKILNSTPVHVAQKAALYTYVGAFHVAAAVFYGGTIAVLAGIPLGYSFGYRPFSVPDVLAGADGEAYDKTIVATRDPNGKCIFLDKNHSSLAPLNADTSFIVINRDEVHFVATDETTLQYRQASAQPIPDQTAIYNVPEGENGTVLKVKQLLGRPFLSDDYQSITCIDPDTNVRGQSLTLHFVKPER